MTDLYGCLSSHTFKLLPSISTEPLLTRSDSHLDVVLEDLPPRWLRRHSYQHVTCAKVDLSSPLGTFRFSRVRVSRLSASILDEKNHHTSERQIRSITPKASFTIEHEVNNKPTRLTLAVMTQEQDKAEGATPHVFSVTDGFQSN